MELVVPGGDNRERSVCQNVDCKYIDYYNPRMVVGAIVEHDDKILLVRRGIQPQKGLWTLPAGFLELHESTQEGAVRETLEESGARVDILSPYAHYDIVAIGQTYVFFRASLCPPYTVASSTAESTEIKLFGIDEIPFDEVR